MRRKLRDKTGLIEIYGPKPPRNIVNTMGGPKLFINFLRTEKRRMEKYGRIAKTWSTKKGTPLEQVSLFVNPVAEVIEDSEEKE